MNDARAGRGLIRSRAYLLAWAATFAATLLLAVFGRPLQHWVESLAPIRWVGLAIVICLGLAVVAWLIHAAARLPWWRAGVVVVAAGVLLAWATTFEYQEETVHVLVFGLLGLLAARAFGLAIALPVIAFCAGADELLQLYLPDRVGDWPDVAKNVASGAAGWLIAWAHAGAPNE